MNKARTSIVMLLLIGMTGCVSSCATLDTAPVHSAPGTTTVLYMVRHAERDEGLDPPLNKEGQARAIALADELENAGVTAVFYPALLRSQQTAEPLIERVNPTVRVFSAVEIADTKALANALVNEVVRDYSGGVVVWIGNTGPVTSTQSGNLQELYTRLGGTCSPPIDYEDLYRVVLTDDKPPAIEKGTYGGASSLD